MNMDVLVWMQGWRTEGIERLFLGIGGVGEGLWALAGAVFWLWGARAAYRMAWAWGLGHGAVTSLKWACRVPRPWELDAAVIPSGAALPGAGGFSFPSGHATCAGALWGGLAEGGRGVIRRWLWAWAAAATLAMAVARMGLGVHTPADVVAGAILGWMAALGAGLLMDWAEAEEKGWRKWALTGGVSAAVAAFCLLLRWNGAEEALRNDVAAAGVAVAALSAAWCMERTWIGYRPEELGDGYRLAGTLLGEAGLWLISRHLGDAAFYALQDRFWAGAVVSVACPLWVFVVWPLTLKGLRGGGTACRSGAIRDCHLGGW